MVKRFWNFFTRIGALVYNSRMSAYVILDIDVRDPLGYEEYKKRGAPTILAYGGKPLVRGGAAEVKEGDWQPQRVVIIEFPSMEQARQWWDSPEYTAARKLRHLAAQTNVVFIEGL
ncbi:MAG TPA: DUF1330 domain-containing protein [Candidatus Omnitrophota bacterium]|nr:DUF1330 domain-containing protein [Candidatus Omnitrophota bacterium]HRZ15415.1 DUF1330 domain-containing protein [Candidatus Omnitrophota bacterium]